jgi:hypothetical protein
VDTITDIPYGLLDVGDIIRVKSIGKDYEMKTGGLVEAPTQI